MSKNRLKEKSNYTLEQLIKFVLGKQIDFDEARKLLRASDSVLKSKGGRNFNGRLTYEQILHIRTRSEVYFNYRKIESEFSKHKARELDLSDLAEEQATC